MLYNWAIPKALNVLFKIKFYMVKHVDMLLYDFHTILGFLHVAALRIPLPYPQVG